MYLRYVKQMISAFLSFFSHGIKNGKDNGAGSDEKSTHKQIIQSYRDKGYTRVGHVDIKTGLFFIEEI